MSKEHTAILIVFILNTLIVIGYILAHIIKKDSKKYGYLIKGFIMFICPVVGPVFFFGSHIMYMIFYKTKVDLSDVVFSKERVNTHLHADEEQGFNVVPLEEAIAVSDTGSLRLLVMNVVRGDIQKSLSSIALALNSEDSETSHYAASVFCVHVAKAHNCKDVAHTVIVRIGANVSYLRLYKLCHRFLASRGAKCRA